MSELVPCRIQITFRKEEPLQYISHLDLLRAWERILRRAELPLAYSAGFNPHPKITIAMPLPVGCTGDRELVDVVLEEPRSVDEIAASLEPVLPEGISLVGIEQVPLKATALPALIREATYEVTLSGVRAPEVEQLVAELMDRDTLKVEFRRKRFDLRPLIGSLLLKKGPGGEMVLEATLLRDEKGRIGRPDVLLEALGLDEYARRIRRTQIVFEAPSPS